MGSHVAGRVVPAADEHLDVAFSEDEEGAVGVALLDDHVVVGEVDDLIVGRREWVVSGLGGVI